MEEQGDYIVQGMINGITELPAKLDETLQQAVQTVTTWGANMLAKAKEVATTMLNGIITVVTELPVKIYNAIVGAITQLSTWGANMLTEGRNRANALVIGIINIVKEIPTKIYNAIIGAVQQVTNWGSRVLEAAKSAMQKVKDGIVNVFSDIGSKFATIGSNIVTGIWNGISAGWDWLKEKVRNLANSLLGAAKSALGIESPSKKFRDQVGVYMARGIGVGFEREMQSVKQQIQNAIPTEFDIDTDVDSGGSRRSGGGLGRGVTVIQNIYADRTDYAKQQREAAKNFRLIARTV